MTAPGSNTAGADALLTFQRIQDHLSPGAALSAKILGGGQVEVSSDGVKIVLSDGQEVLDFGSYGVTLLGHRHPLVVAAVVDALAGAPTASRVLANPVTAAFATALVNECGSPMQRVWLGCSGSEVVEAGLKVARRLTGRERVLAVDGAFHGKTLGALALNGNAAFRRGLDTLLGPTTRVPRTDPGAVEREAAHGDVAALIFEPIQGEAGVRPLDPAVLRQWVNDAHAAGVLVISDEVQVGLGRCGPFSPALFSDLEPDAVLFGKALGGGIMPLSALVATDEFAEPLVSDPTWHTSTFGGHPLSCSAGCSALAALKLHAGNVSALAQRLEDGLERLARAHSGVILEVRGRGLIWGVEFANAGIAGAALIELAQRGLVVSPCLSANTTIRLMPPMVATLADVDRALEIVEAAMPSVSEYA